jgi:hypothetical protein
LVVDPRSVETINYDSAGNVISRVVETPSRERFILGDPRSKTTPKTSEAERVVLGERRVGGVVPTTPREGLNVPTTRTGRRLEDTKPLPQVGYQANRPESKDIQPIRIKLENEPYQFVGETIYQSARQAGFSEPARPTSEGFEGPEGPRVNLPSLGDQPGELFESSFGRSSQAGETSVTRQSAPLEPRGLVFAGEFE